MESITSLQEEKRKYSGYFKDICSYALIIGKKHGFYFQLYKKLKVILASTMKNAHSSTSLKEMNKSGEDSQLIIGETTKEDFRQLLTVFDTLIYSCKNYLSTMDSDILDVFSSLQSFETNLLNTEKSKVQAAKSLRKASLATFTQNQEKINAFYTQIENDHSNFPSNKPKIKAMLLRYFALLSEQKKLLSELNRTHSNYINTLKTSINGIRVSMVQRITHMKSIFFSTIPILMNNTSVLEHFVNYINETRENTEKFWERDFTQFVLASKLARSPRPIEHFTPHPFSFKDHMIHLPYPIRYCEYEEIPLYIATVLEDFVNSNKFELSVAVNDKVFIYEKPVVNWVFVGKVDNSQRGYVPTAILKIIEDDTVFTQRPHLKTAENDIESRSCQLLIKRSKDEDSKLFSCEDIHGHSGVISFDEAYE